MKCESEADHIKAKLQYQFANWFCIICVKVLYAPGSCPYMVLSRRGVPSCVKKIGYCSPFQNKKGDGCRWQPRPKSRS